MTDNSVPRRTLHANLNERNLSIIVFSLFSSWLLAFPFEGQILYAFADYHGISAYPFVAGAVAAVFFGLFSCGFFIRSLETAKKLILISIVFCMLASCMFFFSNSFLWMAALLLAAFLAGCCVAAWGFYFKSGTPKNERIKTMADGLIGSNIMMILLNMAAVHISYQTGLSLSILALLAAFLFALRLPSGNSPLPAPAGQKENQISIVKPFAFLCLFIVVITINSGLMYQVINPAFAHLEWLTSWYWAIPYIVALFIMRNLPRRINRTYILYVAIAMIGLSFIGFMSLGRSIASYLVINTLMLGACGVYDLFWWSILGEMLEFHKNPAIILGMGLSANVLGVLLGGLTGNAVTSSNILSTDPSLLALVVVCATLVILPLLHKHLSSLLKGHVYLSEFSEMSAQEQTNQVDPAARFGNLSERESQVTILLLQGKTYRTIAGELYISENTVKYYVKNIYSKLNIQSRAELIDIILKKKEAAPLK